MLLLHHLAGYRLPSLNDEDAQTQDEIWREIPKLIVPVQERVHQLSNCD